MDKIEEQILKNQLSIMGFIHWELDAENTYGVIGNALTDRCKETRDLLNPKQEPSLPEQTHDGLNKGISKTMGRLNIKFAITERYIKELYVRKLW